MLSVLELFGDQLEKLQLQKLLFILSQKQEEPCYHFVPFKFGCYSFQANADLGTLEKYGQVTQSEKAWIKICSKSFLSELKKEDYIQLLQLNKQFKNYGSSELIRYTYVNYPYFAIRSRIADRHLSFQEMVKVDSVKPSSDRIGLFTIGYEGISLEEYLNKLLTEDIKVLCDVRKNSKSMKYGFSKNQLRSSCEGLGIKYIHIPEVGINSDKRRELNSQADYDVLFEEYNNTVVLETIKQQELIIDLIKQNNRVAITCFEANICQCHRLHLANAIMKNDRVNFDLFHI